MAEEQAVRLPRPEPDSPIVSTAKGKIIVTVSGRLNYSSNDGGVHIERKE